MLKLEKINNAQVVATDEVEMIKLKSGVQKPKQKLLIGVNTSRGVEMYQIEVQDDLAGNVEQGKVYNFSAYIQARQFEGKWYNSIIAYAAESTTAKDGAQVQTDEDTF